LVGLEEVSDVELEVEQLNVEFHSVSPQLSKPLESRMYLLEHGTFQGVEKGPVEIND